MYDLKFRGVKVEGRSTALGLMRRAAAADLEVVHRGTQYWEEDETPYTGPFLALPDGCYYFGWCRVDEPVIVLKRQVVLGNMFIATLPADGQTCSVVPGVLVRLKELLGHSERKLHVYQEAGTGHQLYMMLWPGEAAAGTYPDRPTYLYMGIADLETGEVRHHDN